MLKLRSCPQRRTRTPTSKRAALGRSIAHVTTRKRSRLKLFGESSPCRSAAIQKRTGALEIDVVRLVVLQSRRSKTFLGGNRLPVDLTSGPDNSLDSPRLLRRPSSKISRTFCEFWCFFVAKNFPHRELSVRRRCSLTFTISLISAAGRISKMLPYVSAGC